MSYSELRMFSFYSSFHSFRVGWDQNVYFARENISWCFSSHLEYQQFSWTFPCLSSWRSQWISSSRHPPCTDRPECPAGVCSLAGCQGCCWCGLRPWLPQVPVLELRTLSRILGISHLNRTMFTLYWILIRIAFKSLIQLLELSTKSFLFLCVLIPFFYMFHISKYIYV